MKFKVLLCIAVAIATTFFFASCDDDVNSIGQGIQPGTDDIQMEMDTVLLTAETVELDTDFYLRTRGALLGMLDDPFFGKTKSDFLAEFYCANEKFEVGPDDKKATVDSVFFSMSYSNKKIVGDTLAPMGITIYELDKNLENLDEDFNTSVDPSKYTNKKTILGQRFFSHPDLDVVYSNKQNIGRHLYIEMEKSFGQKLYDAWSEDNTILKNSVNLRKALNGIYVTGDFNDKTLIEIENANLQIEVLVFYSFKRKKINVDADSIVSRVLPLGIAGGARQLNSIINTPPTTKLKAEDGEKMKAYVKAPAGVVTKLTIPLKQIREKAEKKIGNNNYMINSSIFKLTGLTEEEDKLGIKNRPSEMLFVNKADLKNFFYKGEIDGVSSLLIYRQSTKNQQTGEEVSSTNTYHFGSQQTTSLTNNISSLINHYIVKEKDKEDKTEFLEYYLIPVKMEPKAGSNGTMVGLVSHTITPSAAIFRTDGEHLKMPLMFSKHSTIRGR